MNKAVIFDVGGVLTHWGTEMSDDLKAEFGWDDNTYRKFHENYLIPLGKGEITETELWQQATEKLGIRPVELEENLIGRAFSESFQSYKDVLDFVEELRAEGQKLAVLSNTNDVHADITKQKKVFEPFDEVFLSQELGMRKPDPAIYEHVLGKLAIKPEEAIFVDDSSENVSAAASLGIKTVLAQGPDQIINEVRSILNADQTSA
jgi:epoxide hydrolase-like predicted phosphatase